LTRCPWCSVAEHHAQDQAVGRDYSWCCLAGSDLALLEQLAAMHGEGSAIGRTIEAKLESAVVEFREAVPAGYVTLGSRVMFSVDGGAPIGRILVHWDRFFVPRLDLSLASPWGVALLGLKAGHQARAYRRDGSFERIEAMSVRCQPTSPEGAAGAEAAADAGSNVVSLARRSGKRHATVLEPAFDDDPGPAAA
jgi:regulator of nucleoside diphosphate kinase